MRLEEEFDDGTDAAKAKPFKLAKILEDFHDDAIRLASHHVKEFFGDKEFWCGGPIPPHILFSPANLSMVLNTSVEDGVEAAYEMLADDSDVQNRPMLDPDGEVTPDIEFIRDLQYQCAAMKIPKRLSGGIMLMFLELCRGLRKKRSAFSTTL